MNDIKFVTETQRYMENQRNNHPEMYDSRGIFNWQYANENDLAILKNSKHKMDDIRQYLFDHHYEVSASMGPAEWIEVYSSLIDNNHVYFEGLIKSQLTQDKKNELIDSNQTIMSQIQRDFGNVREFK